MDVEEKSSGPTLPWEGTEKIPGMIGGSLPCSGTDSKLLLPREGTELELFLSSDGTEDFEILLPCEGADCRDLLPPKGTYSGGRDLLPPKGADSGVTKGLLSSKGTDFGFVLP